MVHTGSGRVYCRNCDAKLGPRDVEERLNELESVKKRLWTAATIGYEASGRGYSERICVEVEALLHKWRTRGDLHDLIARNLTS